MGKLRRVWGVHGGRDPEYIYTLPKSNAKPDDHTLDVTELYVRLAATRGVGVAFDPEPWSHMRVGKLTLTPDALLTCRPANALSRWMKDRNARPGPREKMAHYCVAFEKHWDKNRDGARFPPVYWIVHTDARARDMQAAIRAQREPGLFIVRLFDDFAKL